MHFLGYKPTTLVLLALVLLMHLNLFQMHLKHTSFHKAMLSVCVCVFPCHFRVCHAGTTTMCIKCVIRALYSGFMGYTRPGTLRIWCVLVASCGPVLTTQLGSSCKRPALCSVLTTTCWTPLFVRV